MLPNFGKIIRKRRKELGLTIEQLAEKADVSDGLIFLIERGKLKDIKISNLIKITDALNIKLSNLFTEQVNDALTLQVLSEIQLIPKSRKEKILKLILELIEINIDIT